MIRRVMVSLIATLMLLTGGAFAAPAMASSGDRVCHNGNGWLAGMWLEVWELDGSTYEVWGGDCTPYQPGIRSMRAPEAWSIYYRRAGEDTIRRCINTRHVTGWCGVYTNINVISVKPN